MTKAELLEAERAQVEFINKLLDVADPQRKVARAVSQPAMREAADEIERLSRELAEERHYHDRTRIMMRGYVEQLQPYSGLRAGTATIVNKGLELISTRFRGEHYVTVLEVEIKDDETGIVLNKVTSHSAEKDTLTIKAFYKAELTSE